MKSHMNQKKGVNALDKESKDKLNQNQNQPLKKQYNQKLMRSKSNNNPNHPKQAVTVDLFENGENKQIQEKNIKNEVSFSGQSERQSLQGQDKGGKDKKIIKAQLNLSSNNPFILASETKNQNSSKDLQNQMLNSPIKEDKIQKTQVLISQLDALSVLRRFQQQHWTSFGSQSGGLGIETYLAVKHVHFKKYRLNIYFLQKAALRIQHWFFKRLALKQQKFKVGIPLPKRMIDEIPLTIEEKRMESLKKQVKEKVSENEHSKQENSSSKSLRASTEFKNRRYQNDNYHSNQSKNSPDKFRQMFSITEKPKDNDDFSEKSIKFDTTTAAIQKVLEERSMRKLEKTFSQPSQRTPRKYSNSDKFKLLQSYEEKSYYKLIPTKELKESLTEQKANEIFQNYNRERDYMSRNRSKSGGSMNRDSTISFQSPEKIQRILVQQNLKDDSGKSSNPFQQQNVQWETPSQQEKKEFQNATKSNAISRFQSPPEVLEDEGNSKVQDVKQLSSQKKNMNKSPVRQQQDKKQIQQLQPVIQDQKQIQSEIMKAQSESLNKKQTMSQRNQNINDGVGQSSQDSRISQNSPIKQSLPNQQRRQSVLQSGSQTRKSQSNIKSYIQSRMNESSQTGRESKNSNANDGYDVAIKKVNEIKKIEKDELTKKRQSVNITSNSFLSQYSKDKNVDKTPLKNQKFENKIEEPIPQKQTILFKKIDNPLSKSIDAPISQSQFLQNQLTSYTEIKENKLLPHSRQESNEIRPRQNPPQPTPLDNVEVIIEKPAEIAQSQDKRRSNNKSVDMTSNQIQNVLKNQPQQKNLEQTLKPLNSNRRSTIFQPALQSARSERQSLVKDFMEVKRALASPRQDHNKIQIKQVEQAKKDHVQSQPNIKQVFNQQVAPKSQLQQLRENREELSQDQKINEFKVLKMQHPKNKDNKHSLNSSQNITLNNTLQSTNQKESVPKPVSREFSFNDQLQSQNQSSQQSQQKPSNQISKQQNQVIKKPQQQSVKQQISHKKSPSQVSDSQLSQIQKEKDKISKIESIAPKREQLKQQALTQRQPVKQAISNHLAVPNQTNQSTDDDQVVIQTNSSNERPKHSLKSYLITVENTSKQENSEEKIKDSRAQTVKDNLRTSSLKHEAPSASVHLQKPLLDKNNLVVDGRMSRNNSQLSISSSSAGTSQGLNTSLLMNTESTILKRSNKYQSSNLTNSLVTKSIALQRVQRQSLDQPISRLKQNELSGGTGVISKDQLSQIKKEILNTHDEIKSVIQPKKRL
ncbi:UNKNOWN [Stylonychia lemnae]|uniref:Uncharacterized protein n=1 Tax=Stylonychia lemnae TaxID=5949 RepID=A0A078BAH9_STYLE|nr:UNKNOWN [Stylonychia lemnae]|eukprot:CDW90262.1 UNKNOWN [Stylonychia lemnae]